MRKHVAVFVTALIRMRGCRHPPHGVCARVVSCVGTQPDLDALVAVSNYSPFKMALSKMMSDTLGLPHLTKVKDSTTAYRSMGWM